VTTPGHNEESQSTLDAMNLGDLTGKTVLDIGCWDGFYSFACEKKNAKRVVASDRFVWDLPDFTDAGFNFAHKHLNSKVEKLHASVEELPEKNLGKFDIVLMLGVLYHAKSPIQYIEIAKELSKGIVIFETAVDLMDIPVPVARYYVHDELNHDPTNFWGFNELAMLGMMRDAGYKNIKSVRLGNQNRMLFIGEV
jgi:tRNA (mo5U34)-methyltransferase